jgi:O-methyltransferase
MSPILPRRYALKGLTKTGPIAFLRARRERAKLRAIYRKYRNYTMVPEDSYIRNLKIAKRLKAIPGNIVECGVWRGGMIAGIAEVLGPSRGYVLLDSFQGLPPAKEIDGAAALAWQAESDSPNYYNNCTAPINAAQAAMCMSGADRVKIVPGWFEDTLPKIELTQGIALLRLDSDWYDSTMTCLNRFHGQMTSGSMIVIDDYQTWDGCARAVHDFISRNQLIWRIRQLDNDVCFIQLP